MMNTTTIDCSLSTAVRTFNVMDHDGNQITDSDGNSIVSCEFGSVISCVLSTEVEELSAEISI